MTGRTWGHELFSTICFDSKKQSLYQTENLETISFLFLATTFLKQASVQGYCFYSWLPNTSFISFQRVQFLQINMAGSIKRLMILHCILENVQFNDKVLYKGKCQEEIFLRDPQGLETCLYGNIQHLALCWATRLHWVSVHELYKDKQWFWRWKVWWMQNINFSRYGKWGKKV